MEGSVQQGINPNLIQQAICGFVDSEYKFDCNYKMKFKFPKLRLFEFIILFFNPNIIYK
jgi:hypothetical protein